MNQTISFPRTLWRHTALVRPAVVGLGLWMTSAADAAAPSRPWAAVTPGGNPVRIAVPAPSEPRFAHLAWPKVIRAKDGTIVLGYLAGTFHGAHGGKSPAVSLSTDQGKTFTPPHILRAFTPGEDYTSSGNLAIGLAEDGAVVLLAMGYRGDEANNIYGWRSMDHGRSWQTTDTSALGPNKTGSVCGTVVAVPGRGLLVQGHYRKGSQPHTQGIWQSVSTDQGRTWAAPTLVTDLDVGEPVLVRSGDRLLTFIRGRGAEAIRQFVAVSDDKGVTWRTTRSAIEASRPGVTGLAHPFAMENPNQPGQIIVLTTERPLRGRVWLWRGDARKQDWKRERVLLNFPKIEGDKHDDFGYTWLLHQSGRQYLMFYYHGGKSGESPIWVTDVEI
jgi:hypothetical protein